MRIRHSPPLHVCLACGSDLVQALDFRPLAPGSCYVELACPDCRWRHSGVHDQAAVDRFDKESARADALILTAAEDLMSSNMREEVDRFAPALAADAILPIDF
jgi:hypothetical protein